MCVSTHWSDVFHYVEPRKRLLAFRVVASIALLMEMATSPTTSLVSSPLRILLYVFVLQLSLIQPLNAVSEPGKWILKVDSVSSHARLVTWGTVQ